MAGETVITVVGNLVDDPELRFTPSGAAVANFRIASTPRTREPSRKTFYSCVRCWGRGCDPTPAPHPGPARHVEDGVKCLILIFIFLLRSTGMNPF